jgi:(heptosyl)LPS beta-1,4-glucosyltransferase
MPTITAAIITWNEERNIQRCIESLRDSVDHIIVLDSFSTDATIAICNQLKAQVIQRKWEGYAASKNYLNAQVNTDLILSLDADEALSPELFEEIKAIRLKGNIGYYSMNRLTNYCGKWIYHSGWFPDVKIRLFPSNALWEGDIVHETLALPVGIEVFQLKGLLSHYSYFSHTQHRQRADHYSRLTALKYLEQGKRVGPLKPYVSGLVRFMKMFVFQFGFLDGSSGWHIARISALSNILKYNEVRNLRNGAKRTS